MVKLDASKSGSFRIGGEIEINRLGFGAMRLTGPGIWGPPTDRAEAIRTLKRVPELGINFIDTANSYGPDVSEQLIREALYPYDGILIATKAGLRRPGAGQSTGWPPEYLRQQAIKSREKLGLKQIGLWQLHRIDPRVPRDEQFSAVRSLQDEGIIRHAGLSNVSVEEIEAASEVFKVATVQNRYNLVDRGSEDVLNYCERHSIGFIPWFPWLQVASPSRAQFWIRWPSPTTPLRARLLSRGFSSAARLCFPFRARRRLRIWRRMSLPSISSSQTKSSRPWITKDGRYGCLEVRLGSLADITAR